MTPVPLLSRVRWPLLALLAACGALAADPGPPGAPAAIPEHPVTLQARDMPLSRVLEEVKKQTTIAVVDRRRAGDDPKLTLDLRGVPFLRALDTIAAAAGGRLSLYERDGRPAVIDRGAAAAPAPVSYSGPFRVRVQKLQLTRNFEAGSDEGLVSLEVAWEPTFQPFYLETQPHDLVVHDERGRPVAAPQEGSSLTAVDGKSAQVIDVRLPGFPRGDRTIGLLKGTLPVIGPTGMLTFTFDTLEKLQADAAARAQKQGEVRCTLSKPKLERTRWTVQVTLEYPPGGPAFESYQSWVVNNRMVLRRADGSELQSTGSSVDSSSSRRAVVSYHFAVKPRQKPADWKVVYRTPASIVSVPIPFEFKDVPLP
jgi:hypothetical protein